MMKEVQFINLLDAPSLISDKVGEKNKQIYFYHTGSSVEKVINIELHNSNSFIQFKGAIFLEGSDKTNLEVNIHHKAGGSRCRVYIKTYLVQKAQFDFSGTIFINKGAHKSDSFLQQDNLVGGGGVICNTAPQLEIKADDVKASHGATVKTFDESDLYYLMSRGISRKKSQNVLADGFLKDVYGKYADKALKSFGIRGLI